MALSAATARSGRAKGKSVTREARARPSGNGSGALAPTLVKAVGRKGKNRVLREGEVLLEQGDTSHDCYVVLDGRLDVVLDGNGAGEVRVATAEAGDVVGEIAALSGDGRSATVRAAERSRIRQLPASAVRSALADDATLAEEIARVATERLRHTQLLEHLLRLFPGVSSEALAAVGALAEWRSLRAGEQLFTQDEPGEDAFLVVTGRLRALARDRRSTDVAIGEAGPGELVGELALIDGSPRSASVLAVRDTHLVRLTRTGFEELIQRFPQAGLETAKTILRRARTAAPAPVPLSVAVIPITPRADVDALLERVTAALDGVRVVGSADADEELGVPGIAQSGDEELGTLRLGYWLEESAARASMLVLRVDDDLTPWTARVLRSADRVVLVADARDDPTPGPAERALWTLLSGGAHAEVNLALVHPPDTALPSGTARWLDARDVARHYHLCAGDDVTHRRLARFLSGTASSVVFGGGGARGFAHLGVIRVLDELGADIDMVAGTSVGAVMAIGPAMGWTPGKIRETALAHFDKVLDYTLPSVSLLRGERISSKLRATVGDADIADLWLPYFCVSTNLTHPGTVIHDRGPLVQAVRASIAIPGVLPPVPYGGELLVDGGVLDNVPVGEMRRRNPHGRILAVDIAPIEGPSARRDYGLAVSGVRAWLDRRRGDGPPSLVSTLIRSSLVASIRDRNRAVDEGAADLYIHVPIPDSGRLDFSGGQAIADDAAGAVRPVLEQWVRGESEEPYVVIESHGNSPAGAAGAKSRRGRVHGVLLLTLRDLQYRSTRFAAVVAGTAVVLALLFLMTGLVEQFHREPRDTVASFGAAAWVLREGATGAFTSAATIDAATSDVIADPSAAPLIAGRHAMRGSPTGPEADIVVVGFRSGRLGQPRVADGRLPGSPNEVVVDETADVGIGDTAHVGSSQYNVVGTTRRTTMFAGMPVVFMPLEGAQALLYRGANLASAVLVGDVPETLPPGLVAMSPDAVADDALRPLERSISSVNLIRVLLWFVAALIVGTMVYLSALERTGDVAVLKALGGSTGQMVVSIALQGALIALAAALAAAVLQRLLVPVFPLHVVVPTRALYQVPGIAVVVALLAGVVGVRKAVRVDPALAFSGAAA